MADSDGMWGPVFSPHRHHGFCSIPTTGLSPTCWMAGILFKSQSELCQSEIVLRFVIPGMNVDASNQEDGLIGFINSLPCRKVFKLGTMEVLFQ